MTTSKAQNPATVRRVAILGGNRIPFARSNTVYATASNQEMLTATVSSMAVPRKTIRSLRSRE